MPGRLTAAFRAAFDRVFAKVAADAAAAAAAAQSFAFVMSFTPVRILTVVVVRLLRVSNGGTVTTSTRRLGSRYALQAKGSPRPRSVSFHVL